MLKNTLINKMATKRIAHALGDLNDEVVYVGGAMVSLYIDDPAAEDIRPTKDIDLTFQITTIGQLEQLRQQLTQRGFIQTHKDGVICRFRYEDLKVDVMSTISVGWAPSNKWFLPGFENAANYQIDEITIRILSLPYFLGTKIEAFLDRGIDDPLMSHDLEDLTYLLNYTSDIDKQIASSPTDIHKYLQEHFAEMINSRDIRNAMEGHLYFEEVDERMEIILERMGGVVG